MGFRREWPRSNPDFWIWRVFSAPPYSGPLFQWWNNEQYSNLWSALLDPWQDCKFVFLFLLRKIQDVPTSLEWAKCRSMALIIYADLPNNPTYLMYCRSVFSVGMHYISCLAGQHRWPTPLCHLLSISVILELFDLLEPDILALIIYADLPSSLCSACRPKKLT